MGHGALPLHAPVRGVPRSRLGQFARDLVAKLRRREHPHPVCEAEYPDAEAERRLHEASGGAERLARWSTKVLVLQDGPPLRARRVHPTVQRIVHDALLSKQCLEVEYQPRLRVAQNYLLAPLGVIYQGSTRALVSTKLDAEFVAVGEPQTFLFHRMRKAKRNAHARPTLATSGSRPSRRAVAPRPSSGSRSRYAHW